jgi:hypothetical protein
MSEKIGGSSSSLTPCQRRPPASLGQIGRVVLKELIDNALVERATSAKLPGNLPQLVERS